jgi:hypothetical protein
MVSIKVEKLLFLSIFALFACRNEESQKSLFGQIIFTESRNLEIPLPDASPTIADFLTLHSDGNLYFFENLNEAISVMDLENGNVLKTIRPKESYQTRMMEVYYGIIPSGDSLIGFHKNILISLDVFRKNVGQEKQPLQTVFYKQERAQAMFFNYYAFQGNIPLISDSTISVVVAPENYPLQDDQNFWEVRLGPNSIHYTDIPLPKKYRDGLIGTSHLVPYRIKQDSKFIYSYPASDSLLIVSEDGSFQWFYAGSEKFSESDIPFLPTENGVIKSKDLYRYHIETPYYGQIMYDPHREYYLRFAYNPLPYESKTGINFWENRSFSMIILNKAFEKIGEFWFPEHSKLNTYNAFVNKDGLWFSRNLAGNLPETEVFRLTLFKYETQ